MFKGRKITSFSFLAFLPSFPQIELQFKPPLTNSYFSVRRYQTKKMQYKEEKLDIINIVKEVGKRLRKEELLIKAKKAGMKIELEMMASYHARKNKVTKIVKIEEDVFYSEGDEEVMVDFIDCETKKGGVIMLNPLQE